MSPELPEEILARVKIVAFQRLLSTGEPVVPHDIAARTGVPEDTVSGVLDTLRRAGRVRLNEAGEVVTGGGLSLEPTAHSIEFDGTTRSTCCGYDALGILGAFGQGGTIRSRSPLTGARIEITFHEGEPRPTGAVLFFADDSCCTSILDEWCPNVNFFEHAEAARTWSERSGVAGVILAINDATAQGAEEWRPMLAEVHGEGADVATEDGVIPTHRRGHAHE